MKIRQGYVSNSSSSSFVAVVTKKAFEAAMEKMEDPRYVKILRHITKKEKRFGQELITLLEYSDTGGFSNIFGDGDRLDPEDIGLTDKEMGVSDVEEDPDADVPEDEDEFYPGDAMYVYEEILEKLAKKKEYKDQILILTDSVG